MNQYNNMLNDDEAVIREMPKVVLHLHLDGSLRPETVKEWIDELLSLTSKLEEISGQSRLEQLPENAKKHINSFRGNVGEWLKDLINCGISTVSLEDVVSKLTVEPENKDLNQYLEKFDLPLFFLQTEEHIERATFELYEDLYNQGVKYAEVRFAPSLHLNSGLSYDRVVEAAIRGMNKAKEKYRIMGHLILCCMRGEGEENRKANEETVNVAERYLGKGVCALDLAGAEALFPTENFKDIFEKAKEKNIPFTIHAGEAAGPESIIEALKMGAQRIGHGIRCIENPAVVKLLSRLKIPLEICPISEIQTNATKKEKFPIGELLRCKIPITISSDNNTVSGTDIITDTMWVVESNDLILNDLITIQENATEVIFGTDEEKVVLKNSIEGFVQRLKDDKAEKSRKKHESKGVEIGD